MKCFGNAAAQEELRAWLRDYRKSDANVLKCAFIVGPSGVGKDHAVDTFSRAFHYFENGFAQNPQQKPKLRLSVLGWSHWFRRTTELFDTLRPLTLDHHDILLPEETEFAKLKQAKPIQTKPSQNTHKPPQTLTVLRNVEAMTRAQVIRLCDLVKLCRGRQAFICCCSSDSWLWRDLPQIKLLQAQCQVIRFWPLSSSDLGSMLRLYESDLSRKAKRAYQQAEKENPSGSSRPLFHALLPRRPSHPEEFEIQPAVAENGATFTGSADRPGLCPWFDHGLGHTKRSAAAPLSLNKKHKTGPMSHEFENANAPFTGFTVTNQLVANELRQQTRFHSFGALCSAPLSHNQWSQRLLQQLGNNPT